AEPGVPSAPDIAPATWSLGMLTRLSREKDLTATAKSAIDQSLAGALGQSRASIDQSFEAGATAALNVWPVRVTPAGPTAALPADPEAWKAWVQCVDALAGADSPGRLRMLLTGLETLLVQGAEPNKNKSIAVVVGDLVTRITWRPEDESRRWLLRWFGDSRVSAAGLNAVASTLATESAAEGVDLTMVLSTSASENTRAELRDRYATVWGVQDSLARDALIAEWTKSAREAINNSYTSLSEADDFAAALVLAR